MSNPTFSPSPATPEDDRFCVPVLVERDDELAIEEESCTIENEQIFRAPKRPWQHLAAGANLRQHTQSLPAACRKLRAAAGKLTAEIHFRL